MQQEIQPSRVKQEVLSSQYTIKFDSMIDEPHLYDAEMDVLENAQPSDIVKIKINTQGGYESTMSMITDAIDNCQAPVIGLVQGYAYSAGGVILMHCDDIIVAEDASMMIHTTQSGYDGNIAEIAGYAEFGKKSADRLTEKAFKGFLSDEEIQRVNRGEALWFNKDEIISRWEQRQSYLVSQQPQEELQLSKEDLADALASIGEQLEGYALAFGMDYTDLLDSLYPPEVVDCRNDNPPEEVPTVYCDTVTPSFDKIKSATTVDSLKKYADILEISYAHNIGIEKLRQRVLDYLESE